MKKRLTGQGKPFEFTTENLEKAAILIRRYPQGRQRSALVPLLDLAQRQTGGWLPREAIEYVSDYLGLPAIQGYEVASFYSMFNLSPVGKYFVQVCTTTPCQLRGAEDILKACHDFAARDDTPTSNSICDSTIKTQNQLDNDTLFSVCEVECLGACVNGPIVQINDTYYEDLDRTAITDILSALKTGKPVNPGSQIGRQGSAPTGGPQVLTSDLRAELKSASDPSFDSDLMKPFVNTKMILDKTIFDKTKKTRDKL